MSQRQSLTIPVEKYPRFSTKKINGVIRVRHFNVFYFLSAIFWFLSLTPRFLISLPFKNTLWLSGISIVFFFLRPVGVGWTPIPSITGPGASVPCGKRLQAYFPKRNRCLEKNTQPIRCCHSDQQFPRVFQQISHGIALHCRRPFINPLSHLLNPSGGLSFFLSFPPPHSFGFGHPKIGCLNYSF